MGRLVQPARRTVGGAQGGSYEASGGQAGGDGGDTYADRVAKYIPGEVIAAYLALDRNLIPSKEAFLEKVRTIGRTAETGTATALSAGGDPALFAQKAFAMLPLGILMVGIVFTPIYIYTVARQSGPGTPWVTHAVIATLAFLVWAYAIQGSALTLGQAGFPYDGSVASAAVVLFTLVSGAFSPAPVGARDDGSRGAGRDGAGRDGGGRGL